MFLIKTFSSVRILQVISGKEAVGRCQTLETVAGPFI